MSLCANRCVGNRTSEEFHYEITHRQLTEVPVNIPHDSSLVSLSHNKLRQLRPSYLPILPVCKIVDFSDNRISVIHTASFENIPNLENISLSKNALESVNLDMFLGLKKLTYLDLSSNKISSISRGKIDQMLKTKNKVFNFPTTLLLHDNQLTTLDRSSFPKLLESPLTLSMQENPFLCDEGLCWLKKSELNGTIHWYQPSSSISVLCTEGVTWETWICAGNRSICNEVVTKQSLREITGNKTISNI